MGSMDWSIELDVGEMPLRSIEGRNLYLQLWKKQTQKQKKTFTRVGNNP